MSSEMSEVPTLLIKVFGAQLGLIKAHVGKWHTLFITLWLLSATVNLSNLPKLNSTKRNKQLIKKALSLRFSFPVCVQQIS